MTDGAGRTLVAAVDFDGTLFEHEYPALGDPIPGAADALRAMRERGWRILIHSSRIALAYSESQRRGVAEDMAEHLDRHGMAWDQIWTERGKPVCQAYVDDRGVHFGGDWQEVLSELEALEGVHTED